MGHPYEFVKNEVLSILRNDLEREEKQMEIDVTDEGMANKLSLKKGTLGTGA